MVDFGRMGRALGSAADDCGWGFWRVGWVLRMNLGVGDGGSASASSLIEKCVMATARCGGGSLASGNFHDGELPL